MYFPGVSIHILCNLSSVVLFCCLLAMFSYCFNPCSRYGMSPLSSWLPHDNIIDVLVRQVSSIEAPAHDSYAHAMLSLLMSLHAGPVSCFPCRSCLFQVRRRITIFGIFYISHTLFLQSIPFKTLHLSSSLYARVVFFHFFQTEIIASRPPSSLPVSPRSVVLLFHRIMFLCLVFFACVFVRLSVFV
jgi:hypothetical protein